MQYVIACLLVVYCITLKLKCTPQLSKHRLLTHYCYSIVSWSLLQFILLNISETAFPRFLRISCFCSVSLFRHCSVKLCPSVTFTSQFCYNSVTPPPPPLNKCTMYSAVNVVLCVPVRVVRSLSPDRNPDYTLSSDQNLGLDSEDYRQDTKTVK